MKLTYRSIGSLIPDPENARSHSKRNIAIIAESLKEFGQRKPIVITAEGLVLAGNGTLEAAKLLEWTEIAVVTVPGSWTISDARAFALADNRTAELATWNGEPASLGFDLPGSPEPQQNPTHEIDVDEFSFDHECPECGFEFDAKK